jgi:hypothetical protein
MAGGALKPIYARGQELSRSPKRKRWDKHHQKKGGGSPPAEFGVHYILEFISLLPQFAKLTTTQHEYKKSGFNKL